MAILIGLSFALAVFYFWLKGDQFARVLTFIATAVAFFFFAMAMHSGQDREPLSGVLPLVLATVAAWFVSGIPTYLKGPTVSYQPREEPRYHWPQEGSSRTQIVPRQD